MNSFPIVLYQNTRGSEHDKDNWEPLTVLKLDKLLPKLPQAEVKTAISEQLVEVYTGMNKQTGRSALELQISYA